MESFNLSEIGQHSDILLEAKDSNCFLLASGPQLWVFSVKGSVLARYKEHSMSISSLCLVSPLSHNGVFIFDSILFI